VIHLAVKEDLLLICFYTLLSSCQKLQVDKGDHAMYLFDFE